jgi:hypothetical protein
MCVEVVVKRCIMVNVVISMRFLFCHHVIWKKIMWVLHACNYVGRGFSMLGN